MSTSEQETTSSERFEMLQEASNILCAANHSVKLLEGIVEEYIHLKGENSGYTYCDQSGDFYIIRTALRVLQEFIRANGLKMDDVR